MSDNLVFLIALGVLTLLFLIFDNKIFSKTSKKKKFVPTNEDFIRVRENNALMDMLDMREANKGDKREESEYLNTGKDILNNTSFIQTQKEAFSKI